jgi:uncharacterized membrane protein
MASQRQSGSKSRNGQSRGGQQRGSGPQNRGGQPRGARPAGAGKSTATKSPAAQAPTAASKTAASKTAAGRAASRNATRPAPAAGIPAEEARDWPVAGAWNRSSLAARIPGGRTLTSLPPAPIWLRWTTWILSLAGLGVSIYLTIEHYSAAPSLAGCPESATFNCVKVTTSPESVVFGIFPVAVLGLAFYAFLVVVNTPIAWRLNIPAINWLRVGSLVVGIGFVLYLVYVELIQVQSICLYCTSVHIITFLLFVLVVFDATFRRPPAKTAVGY